MSGKSRMKVTCNGIRAWLGDFSRIKCPAKYAARMGQCFSATVGAVEYVLGRCNLVYAFVQQDEHLSCCDL
jgi:hypothetical protein